MSLEILLIIAFGGALLTYLVGKVSYKVRDFLAVAVSLALAVFVACLYGRFVEKTFYFGFFGLGLVLRLNMLSWFFAITIAVVGALSIIFSLSYIRGREKTDFYFLMMLLVNAAMLGIVLAGDLISFYIFWEIMSWSAFLLISYNRGPALAAGMKYIIMSIIGSVSFLVGMLSLYVSFDTLNISQVASAITSASPGYILFILTAFAIAFGIKNAVLPFHTWLPDAHSEAPSPFSAVLSGILVRMGMYGFLLIFYVILGLKSFLGLGRGLYSFHYILAWIGAINIVIPTFIAMLQNDAKRLLAWHGVGQGGYMILGVALGTKLAVAGGTFHIVNHTSYIALLFLVVGAVEYRTGGIRDLNSLGGLIKKMPVTFVGALVGACGLIGVPLTNGFVSKWLIYKSLILEGYPFLAFAALIGTWGTILSLYKFLHNIFLGQLPEKYKDIQKSPISMQLPMIVLSLVILLFGILPGIPLKVINAIGTSFGFETLNVTLWGIASETGALNTINIFFAVLIVGIVVWLLFRSAAKSVPVRQEDNYAAGAHIPKDKYHYTAEFYNPLHRMIKPFLRDIIDEFYYWIASLVRSCAGGIRRIYTGDVGNYVMYIILFLSLLIFVQMKWKVW
jgi:NADH-quinone oxidoreductase subunit M